MVLCAPKYLSHCLALPQWNPSHPTAFTERARRSLSSVVIEDDVGPHHLDNLEQELINQLIFTHLMVRK